MIRVAIGDDQALVRAGFAALIEAEEDMTIVGEASSGTEVIHLAERARPDVILMDVRMAGMDGIEATRIISSRADLSYIHVVIVTTFDLDEYIFEGLRAGAAGFLLKDTDPQDLIRAVRVAANGEAMLSPSATRRLIEEFATKTRGSTVVPGISSLTPREREIVILAAKGLSNQEIATRLFMSPSTAKTHAARAMTKLRVRDRVQLVIRAYEAGLVLPGEEA